MRILIADDSQIIRRGIIALLEPQDDLEICGEASDSTGAIQKAAELHPDVILLDISMPGKNGLETARDLRRQFPEIKILMISHHDAQQMLPHSLEAGASGCIDKGRLAVDLAPALRELQELNRL